MDRTYKFILYYTLLGSKKSTPLTRLKSHRNHRKALEYSNRIPAIGTHLYARKQSQTLLDEQENKPSMSNIQLTCH